MKRMIGASVALALFLAAVAPVQAGGYGHRSYGHHGYEHHGYRQYGYRDHGYRRHGHGHRHRGHGSGYAALGILGGAVLLGYLFSRPSYQSAPAYQPAYPAPGPGVAPSVQRNCQPTTGTGYYNGRLATFGGTWCEDAYGNGAVIQGSEYFIGYVQ